MSVREHPQARLTVTDEAKLIQSALACSGDVVYSWDLIKDSISWVGNTADMFGISTPEAVLSDPAVVTAYLGEDDA